MPTKTTNYNLIKPEQDEFYDIAVQNTNMDSIDGIIKTLQDAVNAGANEQEIEALRGELAAHLADGVKHITAAERTNWNAKSNFSGNYNDLTNKPTIPALNNTVTSTSTVQAATANAVKTAYDKAVSAENVANAGMKIATGTYSGNNTENRFINVGFTPKIVQIATTVAIGSSTSAIVHSHSNITVGISSQGRDSISPVRNLDTTNPSYSPYITTNGFNVTGSSSYPTQMNTSGNTYAWVAVG